MGQERVLPNRGAGSLEDTTTPQNTPSSTSDDLVHEIEKAGSPVVKGEDQPSAHRRRSLTSVKVKVEDPKVLHHVVLIDKKTRVEATLDITAQHTLSWKSPITFDGVSLPQASCNLYTFPLCCALGGTDTGIKFTPNGGQLKVLNQLLIALATDEACPFFFKQDEVGAFVMHAIVVCNTDPSLEVSAEIYRRVPKLLTQTHVLHRAGFPLFTGESSFHICCVNRREDLLCELLQLALDKLTHLEVTVVLASQATGVFFGGPPMRWYGGTPLGYACSFGLRKAVQAMLVSGVVSLNDPAGACQMTGMMPIHVVAANGLKSMYDWMTKDLGEELRADVTATVRMGSQVSLGLYQLSPMQVAVRVGNHAMFKHLLRRQCSVLWVWGPVTQYSINLIGVDSAGVGSGDVMELVGRFDAAKETTTLLLDSFMQGFIYQLFRLKWTKFGARIHHARCLIDILGLLLIITMAMRMKLNPSFETQTEIRPIAIAILLLIVFCVEEELRRARLFWQNEQAKLPPPPPKPTPTPGRRNLSLKAAIHMVNVSNHDGAAALLSTVKAAQAMDAAKAQAALRATLKAAPHLDTNLVGVKGTSIDIKGKEKITTSAGLSTETMVKLTMRFVNEHGGTNFAIAATFTIASCILLLCIDFPDISEPVDDYSNYTSNFTSNLSSGLAGVGRRLKAGGGSGGGDGGEPVDSEDDAVADLDFSPYGDGAEEFPGVLWFTLSFSIFFTMVHVATRLVTPFDSLNVFMLSVSKVFKNDLKIFIILFGYFLLTFYFLLFVLYPRTNGELPMLAQMNTFHATIDMLLQLALMGAGGIFDLSPELFEPLSTTQYVDFFVFYVAYYFYVLLALILLLNLLIAMLSFTFEETREESTLQCRTDFSQFILQLELQAVALGMDAKVGEILADGNRVFNFRSVVGGEGSYGAGAVSDGAAGGSNPFDVILADPLARVERDLNDFRVHIAAKLEELLGMHGASHGASMHAPPQKEFKKELAPAPATMRAPHKTGIQTGTNGLLKSPKPERRTSAEGGKDILIAPASAPDADSFTSSMMVSSVLE